MREIIYGTFNRLKAWATAPTVTTLAPPEPDRKPNLQPVIESLVHELARRTGEDDLRKREVLDMVDELREAALMGGSGPWLGPMLFTDAAGPGGLKKVMEAGIRSRESFQGSQGANGLFELELNNWEWRREINFGWLEFSRWGIQQIILLSRLSYIKNPIVRRLVDVCAVYVFGRGVEVSSPDKDANDEIKRFMDRNQKTLGQAALTDLERRKDYDGNLFFAFFTNKVNGESDVRTIDATEMQEIVTDPDDADTEQLFKRQWFEKTFVTQTGLFETKGRCAWYPAIGYDPADKLEQINGFPVMWDSPVYHRKCGTVGKWLFGCPRIYPMLDWAKASRRFLEHCAAVKAALAQIAMTITTKGGQQALAGIKQQLESTVATGNSSWYEQNPTAVAGSIWASGPGTSLAAFKSSGEGGDPDEVKRYWMMCSMVKGVPPTFLGDLMASAYATATSLDRPTELNFMLLQEEWREDLKVIVTYALKNSAKAPNSKFREALEARKTDLKALDIREAARVRNERGDWRYVEAKQPDKNTVEVTVTFPAIREGDIPALVTATVDAMTLGNKGGQVTGIDEKAGVIQLMKLLGMDNAEEVAEEMYPDSEYNANRADQKLTDPVQRAMPTPGGTTQIDPKTGKPIGPTLKTPTMEAAIEHLAGVLERVKESLKKAA